MLRGLYRSTLRVRGRWCSASSFESKLTMSVKDGDFSACRDIIKEMRDTSVEPTPRVYQLLLQLYADQYSEDPDMCFESAKMTFQKARSRGFTKDNAAIWSLMMLTHSKAQDASAARVLDRMRDDDGVPVPKGSMYTEALKMAIKNEFPKKLPPAALRNDRDFNKQHLRQTTPMQYYSD